MQFADALKIEMNLFSFYVVHSLFEVPKACREYEVTVDL